MEVVGVRTSFEGILDGIRVVKDYEHELQTSDFVIGILPSTKKTKYYFNEAFFKKMKRSSIFINIGRGNTVIE
jgi:lactate dehydrogenase-like 2-hydroxyacid dehydrogenase